MKERIVKNRELMFGDNNVSMSTSDVDVPGDGKVKYTQAVSDIDEDIKLKVMSSDISDAIEWYPHQKIQTWKYC